MPLRAWVLPVDGNLVEIPPHVIDRQQIIWPFETPDYDPHMADYGFTPGEVYHRHEVLAGAAYTYLRPGLSLEDVPDAVLDMIVYESAGETAIAD